MTRYSTIKSGTNQLTLPVPAVIVVTLLLETVVVVPVSPAPRVKAKVFG
jgi:hypothetical protein